MSRELKFRIYSFLDKSFHYFTLEEGYPQGIACGVSEPQQFTGLTDKNGKEIFEGDILEYKIESIIAKVYWEYENAGFVVRITPNGGSALMTENYVLNYEIIGNIFEHEHLLK